MRFFAVPLLLLALMLTVEAQLLSRQRRRLDQLGKMIMATTGRHYASFIGYGSFCGKGGSGVPVDKLDACCELHDKCFSKTKKMDKEGKCGPRGGPIFSPYLSKYEYRDNGSGSLVCLDDRSTDYKNCLYELCQCDKVFAECLRPHKDSYDPKHLKESQKVLRDLVKVIETTPNVADWIWEKIDKLMQRV